MSCLIEIDHDDEYEELSCKMLKARRNWRCGECGDIIHKGTEHEVFVGAIDDRIHTHRTCQMCKQIRNKFCCQWTYTGMYEDIECAMENETELENCILMMATEEEYNKLLSKIPHLDDEDED